MVGDLRKPLGERRLLVLDDHVKDLDVGPRAGDPQGEVKGGTAPGAAWHVKHRCEPESYRLWAASSTTLLASVLAGACFGCAASSAARLTSSSPATAFALAAVVRRT
jgi:hypothetical protein